MNPELKRIVSLVQDHTVDEMIDLFTHADANETQVGGSHYASQYQHWDFMADLRPAWPEGCMSKYLARVFKKNGLQDVEKVLHYCYKLMHQVYLGKADVPRGLTVAQRADLYVRFYTAQNLQAPTKDLQNAVKNCFRHLSSWETLRDLRIVFQAVLDLHVLLSAWNESQTKTSDSPVSGEAEVGSEPTAAYVQQDQTPVSPATRKREVLRNLAATTPSILPIRVYSDVLEKSRRNYADKIDLLTSRYDPPFCRDYAEAGLKVELAAFHLRESLPNQQSLRTTLAIACLMDGLSSLLCWYNLRPTNEPLNPVPLLTEAAHAMGIRFEDIMEYMNGDPLPNQAT